MRDPALKGECLSAGPFFSSSSSIQKLLQNSCPRATMSGAVTHHEWSVGREGRFSSWTSPVITPPPHPANHTPAETTQLPCPAPTPPHPTPAPERPTYTWKHWAGPSSVLSLPYPLMRPTLRVEGSGLKMQHLRHNKRLNKLFCSWI